MGLNMSDNIHQLALSKLAKGVQKAAEIVGPTMGAAGGNVAVQSKLPPYATTTNDGATIIQSIQLADPLETIGLNYLKESVERSNSNSGDGSSSTTVLLNAILQEGIRALGEHTIAPLQLKKELDEALPLIEKAIDEQTRGITVEEIPAVAVIAGENLELAATLGEIYRVIGKDGIIHLEGSGTFDTSYQLIEGVRFQGTGYLSPYMVHDEEAKKTGRKETKAVYEKPAILVTKRKIDSVNNLEPLLAALIARGDKSLIIFTDDMDSGVARILIELQKNEGRKINILIIKAPVLFKGYVFEDFAKVTGSTIVEDASGITFKNLQLDHLGTCDTIIVDKEETTVIGIADIAEHLEDLQKEQTTDSKLRLSWLTTKTAILKLGAKSETELGYLRLKAEDAIHSSRLALKGGIVAGGGVALLNCAYRIPNTIGADILKVALTKPFFQIVDNAGIKPTNVEDAADESHGYNAKTGEMVDMFDAGIIDAAIVVKRAIQNALGIASTILTISSVITLPEEKEVSANPFPFQS